MDAKLTVPQTPVKTDSITGHENTTDTWGEDKCLLFPKHESPEDVNDEQRDAFEWEGMSLKEDTYIRCVSDLTNGQFTEDMIFVNYANGFFKNPGFFYSPYTKRGVTVCTDVKNMPTLEVLMRITRDMP